MRNLTLFIMLSLMFTFQIKAQEAVVASGGNASGSGGSASFSIGQILYNLNTGSDGSVAQGVQQAFEISEISSSVSHDEINLSVRVYPVPASTYVKLQIDDHDVQNLDYHLLNVSGKILEKKKISKSVTDIPLANYPKGLYFLFVSEKGKNSKTFKIIKN